MIKAVVFGFWSCIVAVGAAYFGLLWSQTVQDDGKAAAKSVKLTHVSVGQISVPIAAEGKVKGYVVARLGYVARADDLKKLEVKPEVFLFDAVFSAIFKGKVLDIGTVDQKSLTEFSSHVKEKVNTQLGSDVIQQVVTEELGYVPFAQTRGRSPPPSANSVNSASKAAAP